MSDPSDTPRWGKFSDSAEAELPEYRALSGLAVVGFLLGLASALAMVHVGLAFIGFAAVMCSCLALARIARLPGETSGRWLALAGIVLAVFWTTAGVAREITHRRLLDFGSRAFAMQWFEYLKEEHPEKAMEMGTSAASRRPLDDRLMDAYLGDEMEYESLQQFVAKSEVHALLVLKDKAQVRHYACLAAGANDVSQVYAVTYDDHGSKKSFLVQMYLKRAEYEQQGMSGWHVGSTEGPWSPDENKKSPAAG